MDLKIAAIVLAHDATLLTRNQKDFSQIQGLKIEDWSAPLE
jgi:tRNA(fMet)-specific endonuclease VapC